MGDPAPIWKKLFLFIWENNRDCHITMPLSMKRMEWSLKGTSEIRGLERSRSTDKYFCLVYLFLHFYINNNVIAIRRVWGFAITESEPLIFYKTKNPIELRYSVQKDVTKTGNVERRTSSMIQHSCSARVQWPRLADFRMLIEIW